MIAPNPYSPADTEYKLYRGGRETIRLTAQHHCMVERQGWLLHPEIASSIKSIPNPQIADVATGTGVWAVELAEEMPEADVYALDVSEQQYPPSWTWPVNTHFGVLDVLAEVPEEYRQKFDVIHVRLLLGAGPAVDKQIFIDCFRTLLKPGGWLQWDELAWPNMHLVVPPTLRGGTWRMDSTNSLPSVKMMAKHLGIDKKLGWTHIFPEVMQEAGGFSNIQQSYAPMLPRLLKVETDLNVAVLSDLLTMVLESGKIQSQADVAEIKSAIEALQQDQRDGLLYTYNWTNNIAQKSKR